MTWTLRWGRVSHRRTYGTSVRTTTLKEGCDAGKWSPLQVVARACVSDRHISGMGKPCVASKSLMKDSVRWSRSGWKDTVSD